MRDFRTTLLFSLTFFLFPLGALADRPTVKGEDYLKAIVETEASEADLKNIEQNIDTYFENLGPVQEGKVVPLSAALRAVNNRWLDLLVQMNCSGSREIIQVGALTAIDKDIRAHKFFNFSDKKELTNLNIEISLRAARAGNDPKIFNAHHQSLFPWKGWTWEKLFGVLTVFTEKTYPGVNGIKDPQTGNDFISEARPQQMLMAKAFFKYGTSYAGENILEIGYGTAPLLYGLSLILPGRNYRGIDIKEVPAGANERLKKFGVELWQGNAPLDKDAAALVAKNGPYSVIFAVDTLLKEGFEPGVDPEVYLRFLHENLIEGGTLIVLNDFRRPPFFNLTHAKNVGFRTVTYDERWDLGPKTIALFRQLGDQKPMVGQMSLNVWRKGELTLKRMRLQVRP